MEYQMHPIKREIQIEGFNSIYYFEFDKNFSHPPEQHDFWELVYIDTGEVTAITDGFSHTLHQGQVIFHKPMEIHAHVSNKKVPNNMLVVSFTTHSDTMMFFDKKIFTLEKSTKTLLTLFLKEAKSALVTIPGEYRNKNALDFSNAAPASFQLLECYLTEFLLTLFKSQNSSCERIVCTENSRAASQNTLIDFILQYFEKNLYTNISLNDLCSHFLISKSQLCKLFSDTFGESPIEHFSNMKIAEARRLLRDDKYSIGKVADTLGYSSIHNFSRAFKNNVGFSPSEYRKRIGT